MKTKLVAIIVLIAGLQASSFADENGSSVDQNQQLKQLVQSAIQTAAKQYDERAKLAMINGAQSRVRTREGIKSSKKTQEIGRISNIFRNTLNDLITRHKLEKSKALSLLQNELPQECQLADLNCNATSKYRSVNGTCNNIDNPHWGATNAPNARLLEHAYHGEMDEPRGGLEGTSLPKVRDLSLAIHSGDGSSFESEVTHMVAQFGQFLDHDITLTPVNNDKQCCGNPTPDEDCWSISVDETDPHYQNHTTCLNFVRSTPTCIPSSKDANNQRREQFNALTAYIDGSVVYGSDEELFQKLRSHQGGKLVENSEHPGFVPWESDVDPNGKHGTIIAGDVRSNEMPGLSIMHTLFLREHNRIADELSTLRSDWDDERIFQETRRIIAAELQQITYNEFLPTMLGPEAMNNYNLRLPQDVTVHTAYDPSVDATIFNSFATAAYRFGHTLVNGLIQLFMDASIVGTYNVRDNYGKSDQVFQFRNGTSGFDLILNGLIHQNSQASDGEIHSDMRNHLFMSPTFIGSDLAARNIQRGRDHGLPSYNEFRKFCNLAPLTDSWDTGRTGDIEQNAWVKLQSVYTSPLDIDLYTGGLSETPVVGGLSGPTFVCLQSIQFQRLMNGDRFFFTHANVPGSFTSAQLAAIRSRSLGDIICENSLGIKETSRNVFHLPSTKTNPTISCTDASRRLDIHLFAGDDA